MGNLNDRVDWELLQRLARQRPDWHMVLVGPCIMRARRPKRAVSDLASDANVHFVSAVAESELPATISALDVGLIPYALTPATLRINPLKLYQYLAAGLPVVATPIPAVAEGSRRGGRRRDVRAVLVRSGSGRAHRARHGCARRPPRAGALVRLANGRRITSSSSRAQKLRAAR
jgi:hypothetical protein